MGLVVGAITFTGRFFITIILAANVLLLLFIVFSGAIDSRPINRLYWLQADTSDINQAPSVARWTYWGVCERQSDKNVGCSLIKPATPISPLDNFGYSDLLPDDFVNNRDTYFYLSRFAFAFFWVALSFLGIALVFYIFTWCSYSFTKVVFTLILIGALFDLGAVACQTAVTVIARNKFKSDDRSAKLGTALMCIAWASVACSIISFFGTGTSFIHRAWVAHKEYVDMQNYKEQALQYQNKGADQPIVYDTNGDLESSGLGSGEPLPVTGGAGEPQRHESGVKFFKIRRAKHQGDVDSI